MPRRLYTAQGFRALRGAVLSAQESAQIAEAAGERVEPEQLHRCRLGRAPYDWRATAVVGRFVCRGCGINGQCGACAELSGQRVPPGVVPALCALHGGLLEIGITAVAWAVNVPESVILRRRAPRQPETQLSLLAANTAGPSGKEGVSHDRR
jgi:hypothetical protein